MILVIPTFLATALHFVLARSSIATAVVLPPVMVAFPFIPVLAYTLIISAFSYISARVFKRFKPTFDVLAFLRRKGRFSPLPITQTEHELLPTTTACPLPPPSLGVFVGSSNVSTPRTPGFDALPTPPPRLISPPSSPPSQTQTRREPRSLATFPVLEPTIYRHRPRRSRSLGVPIPRPHDWPLQFPPSPPTQQEIIDGNVINKKEENIPLALLSRSVAPAPRAQLPIMHFPYEPQMFIPPPGLNAPSMSAPTMALPKSQPHSGPLIDVSPVLPTSPTSSASSTGTSSTSSGSPPSYPSPSETGSSGSSEVSSSTLDSDAGAQFVGAFAYDWGFDSVLNVPRHSRSGLSRSSRGLSGQFNATEERLDFDILRLEEQMTSEIEGEMDELAEYDVEMFAQAHEPISPQQEEKHLPGIEEDIVLSPPSPGTQTPDLKVTTTPLDGISGIFVESAKEVVTDVADCEPEAQQTLAEASMDPHPSPPPLQDPERRDAEEIFSVFINRNMPLECLEEKPLSSVKEGPHFSPSSPTQIPTPPASPPLAPIPIKRSFTAGEKPGPKVVIITSSTSAPVSPTETKRDNDGIHLHVDEACFTREEQYHNDSGDRETAPGATSVDGDRTPSSLASGRASRLGSPIGDRPAWSLRANDAPSIGLSTAQAAMVQEEITWPRRPEKSEEERNDAKSNETKAEEELVPESALEFADEQDSKLAENPVVVQAPTLELKPSLSSSLPEPEPSPAQKDLATVSASSTAVAPVVVAAGTGRRRNAIRGLPIDVALAMQMRPGLGVGADPAWMVRFLMAVFGWFAIMITGRGGEIDVYAL